MHPRALLAARGLRPRKSLGQNFLMDGAVATRIARLAAAEPPQRVLEVGPGTGALTAALLTLGADVTAIDLDPQMIDVLREQPQLAAAHTIAGDALAFDYAAYAGAEPWVFAGNLPYNVATPLIAACVSLANAPVRIVAMIQRDVAQRLAAAAGTEAYGSLSVHVQLRYEVQRAFDVAPDKFWPRPGVVSSVVVLHRRAELAAPVRDVVRFEEVVRAAFAYRRKTLANSLALALGVARDDVTRILSSLNIEADVRGEALDLRQFAALADALAGRGL